MERLVIMPLVVLLWCGAGGAAEVRRRSDGGGGGGERVLFVALPLHAPVPVRVLQLLSAVPAAPAPLSHREASAASAPPVYAATVPHRWLGKPARPAVAAPQTFHSKTKPLQYETTSTWYGNKQQSETSSWYGEPSAAAAPTQYGQRLVARRPSHAAAATAATAATAGREPAWPERAASHDTADYYEPPAPAPAPAAAGAQQNAPVPVVLYARPTEQGGYKYRKRPAIVKPQPPKKAEPIVIRIHKHRVIRDD